jgi:hypothetical protein
MILFQLTEIISCVECFGSYVGPLADGYACGSLWLDQCPL